MMDVKNRGLTKKEKEEVAEMVISIEEVVRSKPPTVGFAALPFLTALMFESLPDGCTGLKGARELLNYNAEKTISVLKKDGWK